MVVLTLGLERRFVRALSDAGVPLVVQPSDDEAVRAIAERRVAAIVHAHPDPESEARVSRLRADPACDAAPVVAVIPRATFGAAATAWMTGADDVAGPDDAAIVATRLASRLEKPPPRPVPVRAVVASASTLRRIVVGRLLRRAGYDVRFAQEEAEVVRAIEASGDHPPAFVADVEIAGPILRAGRRLPAVLCADADVLPSLRGRPAVAAHDRGRGVEEILFHLNELAYALGRDARTSRRLLFGAPARWRVAGGDECGWGRTVNVSQAGAFLRTLWMPRSASDTLWIELRPDGAPRRALVEARVVWQKTFGASGGPVSPPGMGLVWVDGAKRDRALFDAGYERLRAEEARPDQAPFVTEASRAT